MVLRLRRLLRDERGTLYEVPLLIAFVLIAVALIPACHSVWKAFGIAALYFGGGLFALFGLGLLAAKVSDLGGTEPARRALASAPVRVLIAAFWYALGGLVCGVVAAFASLFIAPHVSANAEGQLLAMRALAAAGALVGLGFVFAARREDPAR